MHVQFERFRLLPFLGPAFIACVAYIDPGNFATNIAGGSKYGYTLVWVIVVCVGAVCLTVAAPDTSCAFCGRAWA